MPRAFAQIGTSFWSEPSIRALTRDAQRAYLLVHSQPELSRCGVLPYRLKRLAQLSIDDTPKTLRKAFSILEKSRHFIVDEDAEEILVRTYVRHDGLLAQPQVVAAMVQDFDLIESTTIRTEFLRELRRIWDIDSLPDNQRKGLRLALGEHETDRYRDRIGAGLGPALAAGIDAGTVPAFDPASPQGCPAGWSAGCEQPHAGAGAPSPAPTPAPTPVAVAASPPSTDGAPRSSGLEEQLLDKHQADFGPLPTITAKKLLEHIRTALGENHPDQVILTALEEWRGRPDAKPGLFPHLVGDAARRPTPPDPDDPLAGLDPDARAWVEEQQALRAGAAR